jgi:hypothetical protein
MNPSLQIHKLQQIWKDFFGGGGNRGKQPQPDMVEESGPSLSLSPAVPALKLKVDTLSIFLVRQEAVTPQACFGKPMFI